MTERRNLSVVVMLAATMVASSLGAQDSLKLTAPKLLVTEKRGPLEPFGLRFLTPISDLRKLAGFREMGPGTWAVTRVPRPHPDFPDYVLVADDSIGLCKVAAMSARINTSSYGRQLRLEFADLKGILSARYGPPSEDIDRLERGSIWDEPRDYMMGLLKKERQLVSMWVKGEGSTKLPSNVRGIVLLAVAQSSEEAIIALSYEHTSLQKCQDRIAKKKNSIL